jgi:hypothetical protein
LDETVNTLVERTAVLEKMLNDWGSALVTVTTELCTNLATLEGTVEIATKDLQSCLMALEARTVPVNNAHASDNPQDSFEPAANAGDNPQDPPTSDQQDTWDRPQHDDDAGDTMDAMPPQCKSMYHSPATASRAAATWAHFHEDRCNHPSTKPSATPIHTPKRAQTRRQPIQNPYCTP